MRAVLIALALLLVAAPAASAASIAYIDDGSVWVSSLDGSKKTRLAEPTPGPNGAMQRWLAVAASDSGRIVAARNEPGKIPRLSWFKVWEPDGSSTIEGPLNAPNGWFIYVYPLSLDLTADGKFMVYGFSNSSLCCPIDFGTGYYARGVNNSVLDPIPVTAVEWPTTYGDRVIGAQGSQVAVQQPGATVFGTTFTPWLDVAGTGLDLRRTDVAANGQLLGFEVEQWTGGDKTTGKIAVVAIQGVDQSPAFPAAVDCFVPTAGVADEVTLSQDATRIAWTDDQGLKVAGAPVGAADPCALGAPPVVISPTATQGSIGGANVEAFLPPAPPSFTPPTTPSAPGTPAPGGKASAPAATPPAKVTTQGLAAGLPVKVKVAKAGKVTISATVPAKVLGLKGKKPVVVAKGSATAEKAGTVTVKLRLTATGKRKQAKLKGARLTLRVAQGRQRSTKRVTVRGG